jgi:hypothetical protein
MRGPAHERLGTPLRCPAGEIVDRLGQLAGMGFQAAIGGVVNVWQVAPLEVIAADVIPAVADL